MSSCVCDFINISNSLAFLPPKIDCETPALVQQLRKTSRVLHELKEDLNKIPNAYIFLETISLQDAKDSNEIENILTINDTIFREQSSNTTISPNASDTINDNTALKYGFECIKKTGLLTVNTIKKMQSIISLNSSMRDIPGTTLQNPVNSHAVYVPPQNIVDIEKLLGNLENYINNNHFHNIHSLIKLAIIHYQFESIYPFYDGNGRTGRLLNILYLVQQGLLDMPVLYLNSYILKYKNDYYRLLDEVRTKNNWEEWIIWLLKGLEQTSVKTIAVVEKIKNLMEDYNHKIKIKYPFYNQPLIDVLCSYPYINNDFFAQKLCIDKDTATNYLDLLDKDGFLTKVEKSLETYYINHSLYTILKNR